MSFRTKSKSLLAQQTLDLWLPTIDEDIQKAIAEPIDNSDRLKYQNSLWLFFLKAWEVLEPATPLSTNWHQELIVEYLELIDEGKIKKLLINIPPRHLKSRLCSVIFPAWQWLRRPHLTHLCCSYVSSLANDLSDDRRTLIQSDWYRSLFPELKLSDTKNRISEFKNNYRGEMNAKGFESGITGIGGIVHVYDDLNDPDKVESDQIRDRTLKRYQDYSVGRRNDPQNYAIIVIQQRTHQKDVSGYILREDKEFTCLVLPTVAERNEKIVFPRSKRIIERQTDDLLHSDRFGEKEVAEAKKTLGAYMFASRHQQRPIPKEGGILKESYWQYYSSRPTCNFLVWSWDTAFKTGTTNDYSVGILLGRWSNNYYILDIFRDRLEYPDLRRRIIALYERDKAQAIVVEDKASGQSLIQELKRSTPLPIIAQKVDRDKIARVNAIAPTIEAGKVFLPHNAPWLADFILETTQFPKAAHDDTVDALSQGLEYLIKSSTTATVTTAGAKRRSAGLKY